MTYLEPEIEIVVLEENNVLTFSQEKEEIWDDFNQ